MYVCVRPFDSDTVAGLTVIVSTTAGVTVSVVEPDTPLNVAVIVDVPTPAPNALPADGIVATRVHEDDQEADAVTFAVVRSEYVAVAVNACVRPFAIEGVSGDSATVSTTAGVTVRVVVGAYPRYVAVIVDVPTPTPFTVPEAVTDPTAVFDDTHVASAVTFDVVPSENVAVAT